MALPANTTFLRCPSCGNESHFIASQVELYNTTVDITPDGWDWSSATHADAEIPNSTMTTCAACGKKAPLMAFDRAYVDAHNSRVRVIVTTTHTKTLTIPANDFDKACSELVKHLGEYDLTSDAPYTISVQPDDPDAEPRILVEGIEEATSDGR